MTLPHRMIGSPLDIDPSPEHRAALEESRADRRQFERADITDGPHHVLVDERQTGKTHLSMRWLLAAPDGVTRVLIVPSAQMADHLRREYDLRPRDQRIISVDQLRRQGGGHAGVEYGIDETVEVLTRLLGLRTSPRLLSVCTATDWQA
ncbi:hypothetical protein [Microbacterium sp. 3J1]|uniref:hypothetical protein n=1 Tax=Microbacterium sp. 3J1 TaxID=861269 RepID=UPI000A55407E|nr:hypothetical protein [Microbacterium sp. 3J1]